MFFKENTKEFWNIENCEHISDQLVTVSTLRPLFTQ